MNTYRMSPTGEQVPLENEPHLDQGQWQGAVFRSSALGGAMFSPPPPTYWEIAPLWERIFVAVAFTFAGFCLLSLILIFISGLPA